MNYDQVIWNIIDKYFKENPYSLVNHQLQSYERFIAEDIPTIFREKNPIRLLKNQDEKTKEFNLQCQIYLGGKEGNKIYYGKPCVYDESTDPSVKQRFMYPNEARLQNMTYGMAIHYDVDIEFIIRIPNEETGELEAQKHSMVLNKVYFGKFPIMLHSSYCLLRDKPRELIFNLGECRNDKGGYFIIDGKEKLIISQEKFANNILYIKDKVNDLYSHSAEVRSESEDTSKPIRTTSVRRVMPSEKNANGHYVVELPNVRKAMPLFIVFRALGICSDKDILKTIFLDIEQNESYLEQLLPSIHDASIIFNQETALKYIATFTKEKTVSQVQYILSDYFLPHVGDINYKEKAFYLGQMTFKLLKVVLGEEAATDRDSFIFKRVELPGMLLKELFNEYYSLQLANIFKKFDKEYYFHTGQYQGLQFINLVMDNHEEAFKDRVVEEGFRKAFKGNWGAQSHTKRDGIVQDLPRLSFNSALSLKRKVNLPMDDSAKIVAPRLLHGSQWGYIDPVDTPDGGNVGLHKHLAITTQITNGYSRNRMTRWLMQHSDLTLLENADYDLCAHSIKIYINGKWVGCSLKPQEMVSKIKQYRRVGCIPIMTSVSWNIQHNEIQIFTDAGRLSRPLFYIERNDKKNNILKINGKETHDLFLKGKFTWQNSVVGFNEPIYTEDESYFKGYGIAFYDPMKLYGVNTVEECFVDGKSSVIEFIDTNESNSAYIDTRINLFKERKELNDIYSESDYSHVEIHPSLIMGVMGNQIVFPNNNQLPRDLFSCGQSKQGVSLYHSNYQNRIDKTGIVLNYGQIPILKSRYFKYINNEEHPYGENVIVAIMCYNAFNVEDSILINKGSVDRGLFSTTYFNAYEAYEEMDKVNGKAVDKKFTDISSIQDSIVGLKPGYDYSQLDDFGLVKEGTVMTDKTVVMGLSSNSVENPSIFVDNSVTPKKGQKGVVDKTFISEKSDGTRLAKVRIRENRIPAVGDKFCSRCGQKGTIGSYVEEYDMPMTADGMVPDIIVNPHALPSRMTIGQLVEMISGKLGLTVGMFGDCTAFIDNGTKNEYIGSLLSKNGYNSSGNEILYNGMTGEQMEADVFFGPTYYMRLKHMVKDKINYRAQGPRTLLTRQTVQGRANDGGLRIGEMERDGIVAHGASCFLNSSLMERGDSYLVAVCNKTGMIAIMNQSQNLFLSPLLDGPLKFEGDLNSNSINVEKISKYGSDFSIIKVPYTFKLLIQELTTMNVQLRIITEDNINQLQSMTFSKNINILMDDKRDDDDNTYENDVPLKQMIERNSDSLEGQYKTENQAPVSNESSDYSSYSDFDLNASPDYGPSPVENALQETREGLNGGRLTIGETVSNLVTDDDNNTVTATTTPEPNEHNHANDLLASFIEKDLVVEENDGEKHMKEEITLPENEDNSTQDPTNKMESLGDLSGGIKIIKNK